MTTDDNKRLVRRYIDEVINTGRVDGIDEFISPDYVEVHHNATHQIGIEGAKQHVLGVRETYPDLTVTVELQIAEGDWVAGRFVAEATHTGEFMGVRPTGNKITLSGINIMRVADGKIVEHWVNYDALGLMQQIGAVPS